jgi:photosystem II stability/assembly factor-like uncharacterized protein
MTHEPSGFSLARADRLAARSPSLRRATIFVALALAIGGVGTAQAENEQAPEQAVQAPLAERSLMLDVCAAGDALLAVGERGHILVSEDGGDTWRQAEVPTRATLTGVFFHDRQLGWVVGHDSVILRTTDGGASWERVYWAPEDEAPFLDVWFSDAQNGFAIGAYGSFYKTSDGGVTWASEYISEDDWHLHQIARSASGRLYIAAEAGFAYRSDDGGATWAALPMPYEGSYFGVLPLEDDVVLLFGLRGHLFRSEDGGETWVEVETGTVAMLNHGLRLADGTIVIAGLGGAVLVSADGGRSFEQRQQSNRRGIQAAIEVEGGGLLAVGELGMRELDVGELTGAAGR